jgi:hypothetical protein
MFHMNESFIVFDFGVELPTLYLDVRLQSSENVSSYTPFPTEQENDNVRAFPIKDLHKRSIHIVLFEAQIIDIVSVNICRLLTR